MDEGSASSQRPLPDNTQRSQETYILASGVIRTRNPSKPAAADLRFRLRGDRDRRKTVHAPNKNRELWIEVLILVNADTAGCWLDLYQWRFPHSAQPEKEYSIYVILR